MGMMTNQEKFAYALRKLRMYNKIIRYGLPEASFNIPEIEKGLMSPFNSEEEKNAKKMLIAASTEAIMSNRAIPNSQKERQARKNAEEVCFALDAVKIDILPMSVPEREEIIKKNAIANRAVKLKRISRFLKRKGTKLAIGAALTAIGSVVSAPIAIPAGAVYGVYTLIPDSWKRTVKKEVVKWTDRAATTVGNMVDRFKETSVGKKLTETVQRINESKVVTTIRSITDSIGKSIENVGNTINKGAKKVRDFLTSFF